MFWRRKLIIRQKTTWTHNGPGTYSIWDKPCCPGCRYCTSVTETVSYYNRPGPIEVYLRRSKGLPVIGITGELHCSPSEIVFNVYGKQIFLIRIKRWSWYLCGFGIRIPGKAVCFTDKRTLIIRNNILFNWSCEKE